MSASAGVGCWSSSRRVRHTHIGCRRKILTSSCVMVLQSVNKQDPLAISGKSGMQSQWLYIWYCLAGGGVASREWDRV
jgi:hypothetical protein